MNIPKNSLLESAIQAPPPASEVALVPSSKEKTWVTCFGFPPGQSELVVEHFRTSKRIPVEDFEPKNDRSANWVHIKLRSQKDVAVALGESGQVLDVSGVKIMIGVTLFLEGDQLDARKRTAAAESTTTTAVQPGGGPRRASTLWEKAAVWLMDM